MSKPWMPRYVSHHPKGWLFGWTRADGWFLLHVGPGFLEWGAFDMEIL